MSNKNAKKNFTYDVGVGLIEKTVRKNGNHEHIYDERHQQGDTGFNEKIHVCIANLSRIPSIYITRLKNEEIDE